MGEEDINEQLRLQKLLLQVQVARRSRINCHYVILILIVMSVWCLLMCTLDIKQQVFLWYVEPWIFLHVMCSHMAYVLSAVFLSYFARNLSRKGTILRKKILARPCFRFFGMLIPLIFQGLMGHDAVLKIDDGLLTELIQLHPDSREVLPPSWLPRFGVEISTLEGSHPQKLDDKVNAALRTFAPTPCNLTNAMEWIKKGDTAEYTHCMQWLNLVDPWEKGHNKNIVVDGIEIQTRRPAWCSPISQNYGASLREYQNQQKSRQARRKLIESQILKSGFSLSEISQTCNKRGKHNSTMDTYAATLFAGADKYGFLPISDVKCKVPIAREKTWWSTRARDGGPFFLRWALGHLFSWRIFLSFFAIALPQVHPSHQLITQFLGCGLAIVCREWVSSTELRSYVYAIGMLVLVIVVICIEWKEPGDNEWPHIKYAKEYFKQLSPVELHLPMNYHIRVINAHLDYSEETYTELVLS